MPWVQFTDFILHDVAAIVIWSYREFASLSYSYQMAMTMMTCSSQLQLQTGD